MNKEEDGELNMTDEELRRWVQSEVEKDEVLVQRRTQLAQVEEWVKQKESHATYTRMLYNSACVSVLECESVIKGVYGMLGLEYQDTDSEEEEGAKPKQNVIQIPEDPKRESEDVSADVEDDYVVIDLGAAVPDTTLEKKPTAEELLASLQMSSELSHSSPPCVKTRESPVPICSPLPHDDASSTSFRPISLPTKCERSPPRSPEPSNNLLSTIKTRESPVPICSPLPHDDTSSTYFRPISLPTKSERSPPRSPEPSNSLLTIKTRESPVPISSPPPSDMAPASFASQDLPIKTENSPSRSPDLSSSLLSTIKTRQSPVPISSAQESVDLLSETFNPLSLPTKSEHSTPRSPKTSNNSLPNTKNRESTAFISRVPSPDVSSSPDTTRGPSPMSYASDTPPLATPTASESDAENHETIVNETSVSAKQSSETQAHPKAVSSSTSSKLLPASTPDDTTAIVTISASKPVNSDTCSTTIRSINTTSSSVSPGTTTRSANKQSNSVPPGITTRSVSKPSNSESPGATAKPADKPSNSVTASKTAKPADKPSNSVTASKTAKPADKPSNSVTASKTAKPADKPSNSVTSSKTVKPADKPSNSVTSCTKTKPADKPSNSVTSNTTTKPANKPSNSVTSSTATKPADKPSNSVTSSTTTTNSTPAAKTSSPASSTTSSTKSSENKEGTETLNIPVQKEVEVKINMEVLARRRTKTWHKATVLDIKETDSGHRYKVKFEGDKGKSMLSGHHLACVNPPLLKDLFVGSRVVATYKEKDQSWMHAAVITEMPDRKNRMRFMVFFDDGHATYVSLPDIRLVCKTMKNVFEDIEDEMCRTEVVEYLKAYPNPIFVVVRVGQESKAERDGEWEDCTINQVDGSLVEICYINDKKREWLYKGSNRLDHIQRIKTRMAEQKPETPSNKVVNTPNQNTTTTTTPPKAATTSTTTTTSTTSTTATTSSKVTAKCVASTSAPQSVFKASSASTSLIAMAKSASINRQPKVVLERITFPMSLSSTTFTVSKTSLATETSSSNRGTKRPAPADIYKSTPLPVAGPWLKYVPHRCSPTCLEQVRPAQKNQHRGQNPLLIPLLHGFRRMTARRRLDGKMSFHVYYRAPCGQSMCEMEEVQDYLCETRCDFLFLEMFCLDPFVLVKRALLPSSMSSRPRLFLPDFSEGKEFVPVPCVNESDTTRPPPLNYTRHRVCAPGVAINTSLDFMVGCDCTDGCRDRTRCSCHQLTVDATSLFTGGPVDVNAGYTHKRLTRYVPTGVYECNPLCRCDPWMCSNRLVQHGQQLRLQLFMTQHKGWGIRCMDDLSKGTFVCIFTGKIVTDSMASSDAVQAGNEYLANLDYIEEVEKLKEGYESEAICSETEDESDKKTIRRMTTVSSKKHAPPTMDCSSDDESTVEKQKKVSGGTVKNTKRDDSEDDSDQSDFSEDLDEDEDYKVSWDEVKFSDGDCQRSYITRRNAKILKSHEKSPKDSYPALPPSISAEQTEVSSSMAKQMRKEGPGESATGFAKKSTRNFAVKSSHRKVKQQEGPVETPPTKKAALCRRNTRSLFSNEKACYLIDAKQDGNMGRYINHSCSPNLFVQNVFVDTHDLRFPWVAFFTSKRIRAGTELTWDYGYEVGSVEGKVVLCCCGSSDCTGRLL